MRILLTNDDGINAPGIIAMHDALRSLGEVMVVAPLTVQSASGHGITFREPLMIREVAVNDRMSGVAVDGRPADCVKLALSHLWPARFGVGTRPDLVVSGMNLGANVGINVLYSGTVAAALEAAFLGVPAIATSLHIGAASQGPTRYDVAAQHARTVIDKLLAGWKAPALPSFGTCVSINMPVTTSAGPTPPIRVCPMNTHGMIDAFTKHENPMGDTYFWSAGTPLAFHATEHGSDVQSLFEGCITVTPLKHDLTDNALLTSTQGAMKG